MELACALMNRIVKSKRIDYEYIKKFTKDYDLLSSHLVKKTPEWQRIYLECSKKL